MVSLPFGCVVHYQLSLISKNSVWHRQGNRALLLLMHLIQLRYNDLFDHSVIERMELCLVMIGRCLDTARRQQRWTSIIVASVLLAIFIYLAFYK
jgi:hypothetical protein